MPTATPASSSVATPSPSTVCRLAAAPVSVGDRHPGQRPDERGHRDGARPGRAQVDDRQRRAEPGPGEAPSIPESTSGLRNTPW